METGNIFSSIRLFIISAKLDAGDIGALYTLAETYGAQLAESVEDATVIITAIQARKRLERHISPEQVISKVIITKHWLVDSVNQQRRLPYAGYLAVPSIPTSDEMTIPAARNSSPPSDVAESSSKKPRLGKQVANEVINLGRFAVQRRSPLICPNQDLLVELAIIKNARRLEGDNRSALSYSRSISVIKAFPQKISSVDQVSPLPSVGPKIVKMVGQFLRFGEIEEARRMASSSRLKALGEFSEIYSIGAAKARILYDIHGLRDMDDLERYAGMYNHSTESQKETLKDSQANDKPNRKILRDMLSIRDDLSKKIPRSEVERMAQVIYEHLEAIQPGCKYTICGGYRRGKPESNDVDIIYTHPVAGKEKGLCAQLVQRLELAGMITHVLHLSSFNSDHGMPRARHFGTGPKIGLDSLDKALTVVRVPPESSLSSPPRSTQSPIRPKLEESSSSESNTTTNLPGGVPNLLYIPPETPHRRLDLIFAPYHAYYTAIVGWTGSTQFERDLRRWAKEVKGYSFDSSGITRIRDTTRIPTTSEINVFEVLGLDYVEPQWRNADA